MPVPQPGQDDFKHVSDQDRNVTGLAHLEMSHWDFGRRSRFAEVSGANRSGTERNGTERNGTASRNLRWVVSLSATPWMVGGGLVWRLDGDGWLRLRLRFERAG